MTKFINVRPVVLIFISLTCGVLVASAFNKNLSAYVCMALLILMPLILYFVYKDGALKKGVLILSFIIFTGMISGFIGYRASVYRFEKSHLNADVYSVQGRITDIAAGDYYHKIIIDKLNIDGKKSSYKAVLYVNDFSELSVGDIVKGNLFLKSYESKNNRFLNSQILNSYRYTASINFSQLSYLGSSGDIFLSVKKSISAALTDNLPTSQANLALGMLIGSDSEIDGDLMQNTRYGGIAHIFSVSGLHIATIAGLFILVFRILKIKGFVPPIVITAILFFYSGVCGFSSSSVRALIMCACYLFITSYGWKKDSLNAIFLSAIIVVLLSPANIFSVGFLLSYSASLFIIVLTRPISAALKFLPKGIRSTIAVSTAAQLGTLPIILSCFGYISLLSLPMNIIFVPLLSLAFTLSFISAAAYLLLGTGAFLFKVTELFLSLSETSIMLIDYSKYIVTGIKFGSFAVLFYLILLIIAGIFNIKKGLKIVISCFMTLILLVGMTAYNLPDKNAVYINAFTVSGTNYLLIKNGGDNILVADNRFSSAFNIQYNLNLIGVEKVKRAVFLNADSEYQYIISAESTVGAEKFFVRGSELTDYFQQNYLIEIDKPHMYNNFTVSAAGEGSLRIEIFGCEIFITDGNAPSYENLPKSDLIFTVKDSGSLKGLSENIFAYGGSGEINDFWRSGRLLFKIKNGKITFS